jgi:hypothetical protein
MAITGSKSIMFAHYKIHVHDNYHNQNQYKYISTYCDANEGHLMVLEILAMFTTLLESNTSLQFDNIF